MTPGVFTVVAARMWPRRFRVLASSGLVLLVAAAVLAVDASLLRAISPLVGPALVLPWTVLCACAWFHPTQGNLSPRAPRIARLPDWLQEVLRWYAALFLDAVVLLGAVAWPLSGIHWP